MTRIAGFCGSSGSGKTTLIVRLIERVRERGETVAVVKHSHHPAGEPHRGDTEAFLRAGANVAVLICPDCTLVISRDDVLRSTDPVETVLGRLSEDLVLVEGFRSTATWPQLAFAEADRQPPENVAGIIRRDGEAAGHAEFHRDDVQGILSFVDRIAARR